MFPTKIGKIFPKLTLTDSPTESSSVLKYTILIIIIINIIIINY